MQIACMYEHEYIGGEHAHAYGGVCVCVHEYIGCEHAHAYVGVCVCT